MNKETRLVGLNKLITQHSVMHRATISADIVASSQHT